MSTLISTLILVLILFTALISLWKRGLPAPPEPLVAPKTKKRRRLRPKTPKNCPLCRAEADQEPVPSCHQSNVMPWSQVKSPRGRKKKVNTHGHACMNPFCTYFGIIDDAIHALVGNGFHGKTDRIQRLKCQACHRCFTARLNTPLYQLKTPTNRIAFILGILAEGITIASLDRLAGHSEKTIRRWRNRAGLHGSRLHELLLQQLTLEHVQVDEIYTRLRSRLDKRWLWIALDVRTKIIPSFTIGSRKAEMAYELIHRLCVVLSPDCVPLFTSDGLNHYFYAVTAHFGSWIRVVGKRRPQWVVSPSLIFGQLVKRYRRRKIVATEYRMQLGEYADLKQFLLASGLGLKLNTAFVERVNLTIRQGIADLGRRTWATALTDQSLLLHLEWWRAYYHFSRYHMSLRGRLHRSINRKGKRHPRLYRQRTPAMAAGITSRCWTVTEILSYPVPASS